MWLESGHKGIGEGAAQSTPALPGLAAALSCRFEDEVAREAAALRSVERAAGSHRPATSSSRALMIPLPCE